VALPNFTVEPPEALVSTTFVAGVATVPDSVSTLVAGVAA
jgi:hypothetical protein